MQHWSLRASLGFMALALSGVAVFAQTARVPITVTPAGVPAQGSGMTVRGIVLKPMRIHGKLRPRPGSRAPTPAELAALRKAGILPNDPQFKAKARAYYRQDAATAKSSRLAKRVMTMTLVRTHLPSIHLEAQRGARKKIRLLIAQFSIAGFRRGGTVVATATTGPSAAPFPEVKSWVVNGNFVQSFPTSTPNNDYEVTAGDQIMFSGQSLGSPSAPPTVVLTMFGCGKVNLNVTATAPDGSYAIATVPSIAINWPKMRGYITVNHATGPRLIYDAPMDQIQATIWVHWEKGTNGAGHATSDGGLHLAEGSTMVTNGGGDRESSYPGWVGGQGDSGTDTYGANVTTLNGWTIASGGVSASCQMHSPTNLIGESVGPLWVASSDGCSIGTSVAPYLHGGNANSLYTVVNWEYDANHTVDYYVGWSLYGPANTRPLTSYSKNGSAPCEN